MIYPNKINEQREIINRKLIPLINRNYIYLDLPYHTNLGDTLIWEGTLQFLMQVPFRCLYSTNLTGYKKPHINKDVTILLHGGGNWGDLWPVHHEFRKQVIADFPANRIIVLPQSVHYEDNSNLEKDIIFFRKHPEVIICVRDSKSYDLLNTHLPNSILLVPDMAFFIDTRPYRSKIKTENGKTLFAKRVDKELRNNMDISQVPEHAEIHDWPTIESTPQCIQTVERLHRKVQKWEHIFHMSLADKVTDRYWKYCIRPKFIKTAVRFLEPYSAVYSTRLHISILSVLLQKDLYILDNSYSKTKNYFETWY